MKVRKFNEDIDVNRKALMNKCLGLFEELWDEKLLLIKLNIVPADHYNSNFYQLFCKVNRDITHKTHKDFDQLFDLLEKIGFEFKLSNDRLDIFIDNINIFIAEMETLVDSKKYNL
jgi:hypothetical protein